jgi:hypothetical protein
MIKMIGIMYWQHDNEKRKRKSIEENTIFSESYAGTGKVAGSFTDGVTGYLH